MKTISRESACALALSLGLLTQSMGAARAADALTDAQAAAIVAPFYEALSAGKDTAALVTQATSTQWISCGANDACRPRDQVIAGIAVLHKAVPDLKWEIQELLVAGNKVIVRGEATGTPSGVFMGVPGGGKSFKVMSIDVHTVEDGKLVRSYHVEDWLAATRQLAAR